MSILMCRSRRQSDGTVTSNIRWNYGHTTVPRHHRDVFVTEYGIAATRGCSDRDTIDRLLHIADAKFQRELVAAALGARKVEAEYVLDDAAAHNRPEVIRSVFDTYREYFPAYPLGTDFTAVEQDLVNALSWLQARTATKMRSLQTMFQAMAVGEDAESTSAVARMQLTAPTGFKQRLLQRMLKLALHRTRK
jgi:hypothetical protein